MSGCECDCHQNPTHGCWCGHQDRDCMAVGFSGEGRCIEPAEVGPFCERHAQESGS